MPGVANLDEISETTIPKTKIATAIQVSWASSTRLRNDRVEPFEQIDVHARRIVWGTHSESPRSGWAKWDQACLDRPGDEAGDFFGARMFDRFVGDLSPAAHHDHAVADFEDVGHAVTDQDHRETLLLHAADQRQHFRDLAHADGRRGLVHQDDL